ncbi:MAG: DUF2232 domain-containing protein [Rhodospirillaceae bacterium]|jgi:hypothetical protein
MHKGIWIAIGCGVLSALLFGMGRVVPSAGLFVIVAAFPPMMVGLAYGTRSVSIASLTGVFAAILSTSLVEGGFYGVFIAFPAWLVVRTALMNRQTSAGDVEWYPIGATVARLAAFGAMVLMLAAIATQGEAGGFRGSVDELLRAKFAQRLGILGSEPGSEAMIQTTVDMFPGMFSAGWMLIMILNAVLAQAILVKQRANARPTPTYTMLDAPEWVYWALVGSAVLALLGSGDIEYLGRNLVIVLAAPFFYIGLGIVHVVVRRQAIPALAFMAFYFLLFISTWMFVAVAGLGFFEQWAVLRSRFAPAQSNPNEED